MLEKSVNNGNKFGGLLTDLSEAFDCTDHKLLIGKLFWCGVLPATFNVTHSHLTSRTQKIKNNKSFSRQSILYFYEYKDSNIVNYADYTTPYAC